MIWLFDLWHNWRANRRLAKAEELEAKERALDAVLETRKAIRKIEGERVRQGKLAAQRKRWANDPLRGVV